ncbi:unnamed protein product, partial [Polarella glacialis]
EYLNSLPHRESSSSQPLHYASSPQPAVQQQPAVNPASPGARSAQSGAAPSTPRQPLSARHSILVEPVTTAEGDWQARPSRPSMPSGPGTPCTPSRFAPP